MTSPHGNPLSPKPRFVPVDARSLAENAQAMISLTEKHKKEAKEMSGLKKSQDDDWQSQLSNWKDKRKSTPSYTPKVVELEPSLDIDMSTTKDSRTQKTFKQLMDKKDGGSSYMYTEEQESSTDISETSGLGASNVSLADSQLSSSLSSDLDASDQLARSRVTSPEQPSRTDVKDQPSRTDVKDQPSRTEVKTTSGLKLDVHSRTGSVKEPSVAARYDPQRTSLSAASKSTTSRWGTELPSAKIAPTAAVVKTTIDKPTYGTSVSAQVEFRDRDEPARRRASNDSILDRKIEVKPSSAGVTFRDKASLFTTPRPSSYIGFSPNKPTDFTKPSRPESMVSRSSLAFTQDVKTVPSPMYNMNRRATVSNWELNHAKTESDKKFVPSVAVSREPVAKIRNIKSFYETATVSEPRAGSNLNGAGSTTSGKYESRLTKPPNFEPVTKTFDLRVQSHNTHEDESRKPMRAFPDSSIKLTSKVSEPLESKLTKNLDTEERSSRDNLTTEISSKSLDVGVKETPSIRPVSVSSYTSEKPRFTQSDKFLSKYQSDTDISSPRTMGSSVKVEEIRNAPEAGEFSTHSIIVKTPTPMSAATRLANKESVYAAYSAKQFVSDIGKNNEEKSSGSHDNIYTSNTSTVLVPSSPKIEMPQAHEVTFSVIPIGSVKTNFQEKKITKSPEASENTLVNTPTVNLKANDSEVKFSENAALKDKEETVLAAKKEEAALRAENEASLMAKEEATLRAKEEAALRASEEAALRASEEAALTAKEEAALNAKEEAALTAKEEAALKSKEEAALKAKEEAALKAKEGAALRAKEEAALKAKEEAALKAKEGAALKAKEEAALRAKEEAALKAKEEAALKAKEEAALKAKEDAALRAKEEAALRAKEEAALRAKEEAALKAKEEAALRAKEEAALKAKEEAALKAKEEVALKAKEEAALGAKEEADLHAKEDAAIKAKEDAVLKAKAEEELKAKEDVAIKTKEESNKDLISDDLILNAMDIKSVTMTDMDAKSDEDVSAKDITNPLPRVIDVEVNEVPGINATTEGDVVDYRSQKVPTRVKPDPPSVKPKPAPPTKPAPPPVKAKPEPPKTKPKPDRPTSQIITTGAQNGVRMRSKESFDIPSDLDSVCRPTLLLDSSAIKSKSRLSNIGSIAARRKPTKVATILFNNMDEDFLDAPSDKKSDRLSAPELPTKPAEPLNDAGIHKSPQFRLPDIKGGFGLRKTKVPDEVVEPRVRSQEVSDNQKDSSVKDDVEDRKTNRRYRLDERTTSDASAPSPINRTASPNKSSTYLTHTGDNTTNQSKRKDTSPVSRRDKTDDNDNVTFVIRDSSSGDVVDTVVSLREDEKDHNVSTNNSEINDDEDNPLDEPPPLPFDQPPPLPSGPPPDLDNDVQISSQSSTGGGSKEEQLRRKCEFLGLDASASQEYSAVTSSRVSSLSSLPSCELVPAESLKNIDNLVSNVSKFQSTQQVNYQSLDTSGFEDDNNDVTGLPIDEQDSCATYDESFSDKHYNNPYSSTISKPFSMPLVWNCEEFKTNYDKYIPRKNCATGMIDKLVDKELDDSIEQSGLKTYKNRLLNSGNLYRGRSKSMEILGESDLSKKFWTVYEDKQEAETTVLKKDSGDESANLQALNVCHTLLSDQERYDDIISRTYDKDDIKYRQIKVLEEPSSVDESDDANSRPLKLRSCSVELEQLVIANQQTSSYTTRYISELLERSKARKVLPNAEKSNEVEFNRNMLASNESVHEESLNRIRNSVSNVSKYKSSEQIGLKSPDTSGFEGDSDYISGISTEDQGSCKNLENDFSDRYDDELCFSRANVTTDMPNVYDLDSFRKQSGTEAPQGRSFANLYRERSKSMECLRGSKLSERNFAAYEDNRNAFEETNDVLSLTNDKYDMQHLPIKLKQDPSVNQTEAIKHRPLKLRTCSVELEQLVIANQQTSSYRTRYISELLGRSYARSSLSTPEKTVEVDTDSDDVFCRNESSKSLVTETQGYDGLSRTKSKSMEFLRGASVPDFSLSLYNDETNFRSPKSCTMESKPYRHHQMTYKSGPNNVSDNASTKSSDRQLKPDYLRSQSTQTNQSEELKTVSSGQTVTFNRKPRTVTSKINSVPKQRVLNNSAWIVTQPQRSKHH